MSTTRNHIGKTFYVSAALPATNDAAGFEALSWTEVKGLQQLPQLGVSHANIDVPDLKSGFTSGIKGAATGVDASAAFRFLDSSDPGQVILKDQANHAQGNISVKIGTGSGTDNALTSGDTVQYAQGYAHSYQEMQGDSTTHEGFTVSFHQNDFTVDGTEPV